MNLLVKKKNLFRFARYIMTNIIKRSSDRPRNIFEELFDDDFENVFSIIPRSKAREMSRFGTFGWSPLVDVKETSDALIFNAEMPGVKEEEIEVTIENNVLTIKGERKFERDEKNENYHRVERAYGSFQRSFSLPNNLDVDNVKADYSDGMLEISFPKKEEAKPRQVKVDLKKK
jgi:HSP20 family protein